MNPLQAEGERARPMQFVDLKAQYATLRASIDARIQTVLEHGQYIMGPEVAELESRLAEYTRARHCITVASGTEALLIALMALEIGPGDEVITTPFTFVATAEVIVLLGARPVFVDIDPVSFNLDPQLIEAAITPRTRALMPVSLYGQPAPMDAINAIAGRHGLPVIEDAAQSFGATWLEQRSGHLSTIGCTSFFPSKPLGAYGDGGAIFTDDDALAKAMREIRVHGQERRYYHTRVGVGGRMDTLQCAIVLAKLERFDWEIGQRQRLASRYTQQLVDTPGVSVPHIAGECTSAWAQYTIEVAQRDAFARALASRGVPTAIHYPVPLNVQPAYAHLCCPHCTPHSAAAAQRVLSLPMHAYLEAADQDRVIAAVREVAAGLSAGDGAARGASGSAA